MLDHLPIPDPGDATTAWGIVLVACWIGCVTDIRARRLPNALTLPLFLTGLAFAATTGGAAGLGGALAAAAILAIPYIVLFLCAGGGAGDAKMMAGVGAWLGLSQGVYALVVIALLGGVLGIAWSMFSGSTASLFIRLRTALNGALGLAHGRLTPSECLAFMPPAGGNARIPYGLAICLGATAAYGGALQWHA